MNPLSLAKTVAFNRLGLVPRPSWCTYLVSFRCNARCGMCDSWRMKPGREMSVDEIASVFQKVGALDVVRLTGGEPFLRDDFSEIAEAVRRGARPAVLHVTTNGSLTEQVVSFAERYREPRRLQFMISFDGLEGEHDRSRGSEVRFATALETVRALAGLRERLGIAVSVNHTVISERSLEDHLGLEARLAEWHVDVHSVLAYADSAMYGIRSRGKKATHMIVPTGYPLHPALEGADVLGFVERELAEVGALRQRTHRIGKKYYLEGLRARLSKEPAPQPKPRCVALRSHLRILPDGSVPVCQFNTEVVGNLLEEDFETLWKNAKAREQRRWVDACPGCWAECEVIPSAIYTADILRRLPARLP